MAIETDAHGNPDFALAGRAAEIVARRGIGRIHVSMSHDGGIATAFVVAERTAATEGSPASEAAS